MEGNYPRSNKLYPAHYALLYYTRGRPRVSNRIRLPIQTCRLSWIHSEVMDRSTKQQKYTTDIESAWNFTIPSTSANHSKKAHVFC